MVIKMNRAEFQNRMLKLIRTSNLTFEAQIQMNNFIMQEIIWDMLQELGVVLGDVSEMSWSALVLLREEIEREVLYRLANNHIGPTK